MMCGEAGVWKWCRCLARDGRLAVGWVCWLCYWLWWSMKFLGMVNIMSSACWPREPEPEVKRGCASLQGSSLYALGPRDPRVLLRKRLAAPRGLASDDLCFFTILERRDLSLYIRYRQKVDMYLISATWRCRTTQNMLEKLLISIRKLSGNAPSECSGRRKNREINWNKIQGGDFLTPKFLCTQLVRSG